MTEKRFELTKADPSISQYRIYDYHNENAYFINADEHTLQCIVDVLNTQEARIQKMIQTGQEHCLDTTELEQHLQWLKNRRKKLLNEKKL